MDGLNIRHVCGLCMGFGYRFENVITCLRIDIDRCNLFPAFKLGRLRLCSIIPEPCLGKSCYNSYFISIDMCVKCPGMIPICRRVSCCLLDNIQVL